MYKPVIFREYDIRGIYNEEFDDNFAYELGRSFVAYLSDSSVKNPTITIGNDARLSCPSITKALSKGIRECGGTVIQLGLVTTPVCYFSTFALENIDGAIMVTGSHNPSNYNGFKISKGKATIFGEEIQKLRIIMEQKRFLTATEGKESTLDIKPQYYARYKKEFGNIKPINVVLDCGNGAAGSILRGLYNAVGLDPIILFEEPDGTFPNHHPDPTVEKNLKHLQQKVKETGAICGIGFDGDADRIGVVDHNGRMLYGDELMVVISRSILAEQKGAKIIGDVKCSDRLYQDIAKHGGVPIMWKTGHSLVKEKIKIEKAPFGGEMSGHIFFSDRNYGYDDAPYAGLRLIEILSKTGKTIPELLEGFPDAFNTPEIRIDTTEEKKILIVQKMKEAFSDSGSKEYKIDLTDGIRLSFEDGWALCRSSNTQPVLVLRYESTTQAGLDRIRNRVEAVVNKYL